MSCFGAPPAATRTIPELIGLSMGPWSPEYPLLGYSKYASVGVDIKCGKGRQWQNAKVQRFPGTSGSFFAGVLICTASPACIIDSLLLHLLSTAIRAGE